VKVEGFMLGFLAASSLSTSGFTGELSGILAIRIHLDASYA
jgi:hypothetical protein